MAQPTQFDPPGLKGDGVCSARMCQRPATKRGMCGRCYQRWRKATLNGGRPSVTPLERFMSMVNTQAGAPPSHAPWLGPCWLWTGGTSGAGYGVFALNGANIRAHEFALTSIAGDSKPIGHVACHRCDNPSCVRPSHLYFGTRQDNSDDAWGRARMPVGSERHGARLNEFMVRDIRERVAAGEPQQILAEEYGVERSHISNIVTMKKWVHAGGPHPKRREQP